MVFVNIIVDMRSVKFIQRVFKSGLFIGIGSFFAYFIINEYVRAYTVEPSIGLIIFVLVTVLVFSTKLLPLLINTVRTSLLAERVHNTLYVIAGIELVIIATLEPVLETHVIAVVAMVALNAYIFDLVQYIHSRKSKQETQTSMVPDVPKINPDDAVDTQKRQVRTLLRLIKKHTERTDSQSLTIGLDAKWGDGKSSIVQMVKTELISNKKLIWVDFEAWRYPTEQDLIIGFYETLGSSINEVLPTLQDERKVLIKFAQNLVSLSESTSFLKGILTSLPSSERRRVDKMRDNLMLNQKKLVLVVDDVDRQLDKSLIYRALQLCQVFKSEFPGSITLIPADYEKITEELELSTDVNFLQKITDVNISVSSPRIEEQIEKFDEQIDSKYDLQFDPKLFRLMRNFRGVLRVANQFNLLTHELEGEVNLQDIFSMCVIEHCAPNMFRHIKNNHHLYVNTERNNDIEWMWMEEKDMDEFRAHLINKQITQLKPGSTTTDIINVIKDLFPVAKNALRAEGVGRTALDGRKMEKEKKIGLEKHLLPFFHYSEKSKASKNIQELVESMMLTYRNSDPADKTGWLIKFFREEDYDDLSNKVLEIIDTYLRSDDDFDVELARNVLAAYFTNTGYLVRDEQSTLLRILGVIDERVRSDEEINEIFLDISTFLRHPSAGLRLLLYMHPKRSNQFFRLKDYKDYQQLRSQVLEYCDIFYEKSPIDIFDEDVSDNNEWRFIAYQWGMSVSNDVPEQLNKERMMRVNKYIEIIITNDPQKLHRFVRGVYWNHDLMTDKYRYIPEVEGPYNLHNIVSIVKEKLESPEGLADLQITELQAFLEVANDYRKKMTEKSLPNSTD